MYFEIQAMHNQLLSQLKSKSIDYSCLKNALVPSKQKQEAVFVFNSLALGNTWYGYAVFEKLIPLLNKNSSHSILVGDYLGEGPRGISVFKESVCLARSIKYEFSSQFFMVYINNLSDKMINTIRNSLASWEPYIGFSNMTHFSELKVFLSTMLSNHALKYKSIILQPHEADRDDTDDINMSGYPYEENGYKCRSVSSDHFGVFLGYKIERPVFHGFETDTEFSLNSISKDPQNLNEFDVEVEEAKLDYIKREKSGTLKSIGLETIDTKQLELLLKNKVSSNYIYSMHFNPKFEISKFNVIVELQGKSKKPLRLLAALEYKATEKKLRLITLF